MRIGNVEINGTVVAAPMAGVTDGVYREILTGFGAALTYTEMISAKGLIYGGEGTLRLLEMGRTSIPQTAQLFGRVPEEMAEAARILEKYPAYQIIDINCGCPAHKIIKNGEGSALMREPELIGRIVKAVAEAVNKPVTVKLRKGFGRNDDTAVKAAVIAWKSGASAVCVHGRTRDQMYSGKADWDVIKRVKEAVDVPVIGNGDVDSPEAALRMPEETGCDAVMIGRGLWGNPWLVKRSDVYIKTGELLPAPTLEQRVEMIMTHMERLAAVKGEIAAVREMRRHIHMYVKGIPGAQKLRAGVNTAETIDGVRNILFI
ncbi:MAG: tRNA dihydrouridine synthase DusB [Clostridiales bacterium]|jgi:tRNA-dihydrouridine synthase B|nr:tRNA dihydrouridine synthase DusB [Clostridiales bacterium]